MHRAWHAWLAIVLLLAQYGYIFYPLNEYSSLKAIAFLAAIIIPIFVVFLVPATNLIYKAAWYLLAFQIALLLYTAIPHILSGLQMLNKQIKHSGLNGYGIYSLFIQPVVYFFFSVVNLRKLIVDQFAKKSR